MLFNRQEKNVDNEFESSFIENFIKELGEKLIKMQGKEIMKFLWIGYYLVI